MNEYKGHRFGYNGRIMYADVDEFTSDGSVMEIHSRYVSERDIFERSVALYVSRAAYNNTDEVMYQSNFDSLLRDFPNMLVKIWDMGGEMLALDVTDFDPDADEWDPNSGSKGSLLAILIALDDEYPVYDEDDFSGREWEQYEEELHGELDWTFRRAERLYGLSQTVVDDFWDDEIRDKAWEIANERHEFFPEMPDEDAQVDAILDAVQIVFWGAIGAVQEENSDPLF